MSSGALSLAGLSFPKSVSSRPRPLVSMTATASPPASTMSSGALSFAGLSFPMSISRRPRPRPRPLVSMAATASPPVATPPRSRSLYDVLRVTSKATAGEIKAAYRNLAKQLHPDVTPAGAEDFMEIRLAYETLSDPASRAEYDLSLSRRRWRPLFGGEGTRSRKWETDQCW